MIKIEDYFTEDTYKRLEAIEKDILENPKHLDKYLDLRSEEGHDLLGLALRHDKKELSHYLIDKGIGINHINGRAEHTIVDAEKDTIIRLLRHKDLKNKPLVYHHLIHHKYELFINNTDNFASQIECFDLGEISRKDLIAIEILVDNSKLPVGDIWKKFKEKNNIVIDFKDIFYHLVDIHEKLEPYIYTHDKHIDKKIRKKHFLYKKMVSYAIENLDKSRYDNPYRNKWLAILYSRDHRQLNKENDNPNNQFNYTFNNLFQNIYFRYGRSDKYFTDKIFYEEFKTEIHTKFYASPPIEKDFMSLLKKYGLKSISFPGNYSPHIVYDYLDSQLQNLSEKFDIKAEFLGANTLNIGIQSNLSGEKYLGFYMDDIKYLALVASTATQSLLSYSLCDFKKFARFEEIKNNDASIWGHEYTHFLQHMKGEPYFEKSLYEPWKEIRKELGGSYHKNECIDLLGREFKKYYAEKIEKFDYLIKRCLEQFNTKYQKDKRYREAENNLLNFMKDLKDTNRTYLTDYCKTIIHAYHSQHKSFFHHELWKQLDLNDKNKIYYNKAIEIHARLVEEVIFPNVSRSNTIGYLGIHSNKEEILHKIKPKLIAFNKMLASSLEILSQQNELKPAQRRLPRVG